MAYCYNCFRELTEEGGPCPSCGYDPAEDEGKYPLALRHGSILAGQYITGRVLGQGGFGITYMAYDVRLAQKVAIKEFMPRGTAFRETGSPRMTAYSGQHQDDYAYGLELFLNEARTLAKFQGNPNIVGVRMFFEENGTAYFVMDYIQGVNFTRYIADHGGKLPWKEALRLLTPVMDALDAVHREGIIHRDVSPDNIFITTDGVVKLLDFGAARYSMGDKSQSLDLILKPGYAPIEQYYRRGKQGPYTDVYALSACLYASVTGMVPPESAERTYNDSMKPPSKLGAGLPAGLEQVLLKGLAVQPEGRYQTVKELKAALLSPQAQTRTQTHSQTQTRTQTQTHSQTQTQTQVRTQPSPPPVPLKKIQRYVLLGVMLLLLCPLLGILTIVPLSNMGLSYFLYMLPACISLIAPPIVILLMAKRLGLEGAPLKRLEKAAWLLILTLAFGLIGTRINASTGPLSTLLGAWILFFIAFLEAQLMIPGHPKYGAKVRGVNKLKAIGILFLGGGVLSFIAGFF